MKITRNLVLATLFVSLTGLATAVSALAAEFTVDKDHSTVEFQVSHLLGKQKGSFDNFDGSFEFNASAPEKAHVKFSIDAASIDTKNAKRDEHLKSQDFFDAGKFKTLSFDGKGLKPNGDKKYTLTGNLTMHGVTKEVTFDVEYLGSLKDPWGNNRSAFTAVSKISRKDFGLTWNKVLETGGLMVGDEVTMMLNLEAVEKAPAKKK